MALSNFGGNRYQIDVDAALSSQDTNSNTSVVYARMIVRRIGGSGYSTNNAQSWNFNVNGGQLAAGTWTYNFSNYATHDHWVWQGTWTVYHNADGTAPAQSYSGTVNMDSGLGSGSAGGSITPPTIPRASTPSLSANPITAGSAVTVNMNRASASFTHDVYYAFGNTGWVGIQGGVATSVSWTPPLSLLQQIPNSVSGNGSIKVNTMSGSTLVGEKTIGFTLNAPASAKPVLSAPTITDTKTTSVSGSAVSVSSIVGAYVQGFSDLKVVVNAVGYQGSTVTSRTFNIGGSSTNSGNALPSPNSGTVAVGYSATDSRGRSETGSTNITVLPYTSPTVSAFQVRRATALNSLNEDGTQLQVDLNAAVQSLIVSTQRNAIKIKAYTKPRGAPDTSYVLRHTIGPTANTITYNSRFLIPGGPYPIDQSFDIKLEVEDKLTRAINLTTITTSDVYMHWGPNGVGVGKYWEQGSLDVDGRVYSSDVMHASGGQLVMTDHARQVTDWDAATTSGFFQCSNSATNAPFPWWWNGRVEARGAEIVQTVSNITSKANLFWSRTRNGSGVWTPWMRSDNLMIPTSVVGGSFDNQTGRMNLTAGSKSWAMNGVFTEEYRKYRIDYQWYTADANGAQFRLRNGGTDNSSANYWYHGVYSDAASGNALVSRGTGVTSLGFPFISSNGRSGYIHVSEPRYTAGNANQKRFEWHDVHTSGNPGQTIGGGWLAGNDTASFDGFSVVLSNSALSGTHTGSHAWMSVTGIA